LRSQERPRDPTNPVPVETGPAHNRANHTIVLHRRQHDPATRDYIEYRIAEGKSRRDATRLLKRYLARHLSRLLQQEPLMT
jgi:hypothetical protein